VRGDIWGGWCRIHMLLQPTLAVLVSCLPDPVQRVVDDRLITSEDALPLPLAGTAKVEVEVTVAVS